MNWWNSLTLRLVAALLLAATLYGGIASYTSYQNAEHESTEIFDEQLTRAAQTLLTMGNFADDEHPADPEILDHQHQQVAFFQLWREEKGELRALLRSRDDGREFPFHQNLPDGFSEHWIGDQHWRFYRQSQADRSIDVVVGENQAARRDLALQIAWQGIAPFIYGLPLLGLVASALVFLGLRPLRRLAQELYQRSPQEMAPLDLTHLPAELKPPVEAMNSLLLGLARAFERERRFTSDAAHELRTPLAALRAQLDVARFEEETPAARSESIEKASQAARRLQHLVTQLLLLCRLDVSAHLDCTPVMLDEIAQRVCADLAPAAVRKHIDISLEAQPARLAEGNQELLYALLRNLVDNAIRFTPENGHVVVAIRPEHDELVLEVGDSGLGVAKENIQHLGQRFRRFAPAQAEGVGLGLSIVSRVADLHQASLAFAPDATRGGLLVTVRFPATARPQR